ncbi:HrpJ domain-containing protein [Roseicyclus amphidinii]|uniref:HrpJ domain-containing protein n=1 Tax=Roseicyclus amphidinii TaxID=3034232 RepID=UPI0024E085B0|nr:HrpJ domain-containing protein [Roseicyclus sp. Amp-Y-6]
MSITSARETIQSQIATQNAASPVGAEVMAEAMGRSRGTGEPVQVSAAKADMTDALEELGMAAATRGKTDLDKMKLRRGAGANLEALGRIADYYDKLPSMPKDQQLRDLVKQFKDFEDLFRQDMGGGGGGKLPTAEDLREALRAFDGEIAHQFAALETIRQQAVENGAPADYIALLDTIRAEMRAPDAARAIMAGFAAARPAQALADQIGADPQTVRDSYRALLREPPSMARAFDELRKFNMVQNFDAVIDSFVSAAGSEMSSFGPSTDAAQLREVVAELTTLRSLRTVLDMAMDTGMKLDRMYPPGPGAARPPGEEIAARLFGFTSSAMPALADAERLVQPYADEPPEVAVAAVNMLSDLHARMPMAAIPSDAARLSQAKVLLTLSDRLVAAEEAAQA